MSAKDKYQTIDSMAWSFRKRVKIIPGVHLNIGKRGISTSMGIPGARVAIGTSGSYFSTGIPGLGTSSRTNLSSSHSPSRDVLPPDSLSYHSPDIMSPGSIYSADLHEITSQNMQGIKEAILLARAQRTSLHDDLKKIGQAIKSTKLKLLLSHIFLYGYLKPSIPAGLTVDLRTQEVALQEAQEQLQKSFVDLDADFEPEHKVKYDAMVAAFEDLSRCHQIWDITRAHFEDRVITRSSASAFVSRRSVRFALRTIPEFRSVLQALYFQNANGADLYIYPNFVVLYANSSDFAVIGLDDIDFQYGHVRFTATHVVPADSTIVGQTWAKVNKNGTPDRRFKGNYQIPVVQYGEIRLKTSTGLREEYQFSNYAHTATFGRAFQDYQRSLNESDLQL